MRRIALRLVTLIGVLFAVSVLSFSLLDFLPGDPVVQILGPNASDQEQYDIVEHDLGRDKSMAEQYVKYVSGAVRGDLGKSYIDRQPVSTLIGERLPVTIELLLLTQILSVLITLPVAVWSAYRQGGIFDRAATGFSFAALSFPNFAVGVVLVYLLAVQAQLVPATGYTRITEDLGQNLRSVILPVIILSLGTTAVYIRLLRSDMIATLQEDFILMAKAKGLPTWQILIRHALRPSSFSLLTVVAINLGTLIGGSVIVEYLFALPGVGLLAIQRIGQRDYLVVQGFVLLVAATFVLANFLVDAMYSVLDPRIRRGGG